MKVLHGPKNFAMQPMLIVEALRKKGIEANHIQFISGDTHSLGFRLDKVYQLDEKWKALKDSLNADYDIYHFWQNSLLYGLGNAWPTGLDLPLIKSRHKKIIHRFTGFDLRLPTQDLEFNPHSPFRYGAVPPFNEKERQHHIEFLRNYVDQFLVQDPELLQFMPDAKIIPRGLDLNEWSFKGITKTDCPLIVHAPTKNAYKGTSFVLKAIEELKDEKGLKFDFKLIQNMTQNEARKQYEQADIIIDQLLIGATGVLTLEGWALGKPVAVYLREDLFKPFYGNKNLPIANVNPDNIKDSLRKLIKDYEWRAELSAQGRKTVEQYHNIEDVADQCLKLYKGLLKKKSITPQNTTDIDLLMAQNNLVSLAKNQITLALQKTLSEKYKRPLRKLRDWWRGLFFKSKKS